MAPDIDRFAPAIEGIARTENSAGEHDSQADVAEHRDVGAAVVQALHIRLLNVRLPGKLLHNLKHLSAFPFYPFWTACPVKKMNLSITHIIAQTQEKQKKNLQMIRNML